MSQILFEELLISKEIESAIKEMGFVNPTEIQQKAIPIIRNGCDIIGKSQTGTGKTLAFGIPAIESLNITDKCVQILILCPTRELAMQACEEMKKLCKYKKDVKIVDVYGGAPIERQIVKLKNANIVIGTPGRIMDHMRRKTLKLSSLKMIILDEADEMLSMGFREDIETILDKTPENRQTLLFSATMPKEIMDLTKRYQKNPKLIEINNKQLTVKNIRQIYCNVPMGRKMDTLNLLLRFYSPKRAILFCNTKKMVDDINDYLNKYNFNVCSLHGDMKQSQRSKVMDSFKKGNTDILIATDVAARGIDVNNIEYVINYDIPQNLEYYVHRIGRTGRAGKSGTAITICSGKKQLEIIKKIAKLTKSEIEFRSVPTIEDINIRRSENILSKIEKSISENVNLEHYHIIEELVKRGHNPINIAAAVLEEVFKTQNINDLKNVESLKSVNIIKKDENFKKIVISIGRSNKVAPNHIVGAITEATELSGKDIGKIEIYDEKTIVDIPSNMLESTVSLMKGLKICGVKTITIPHKKSNKNNLSITNKDIRGKKKPIRRTKRKNKNLK